MTQLLDLYGFISVLLRGLTLSFEALTVGGIIFLLAVARHVLATRALTWFALLLMLTTISSTYLNAVILAATANLSWAEASSAPFCMAGALMATGALVAVIFIRTRWASVAGPFACVLILAGSVMNSHSFARIVHQRSAMALTWVHHLAGAAWIGGMLYLLLTLRNLPSASEGPKIAKRFSRLAMISVTAVVAAGLTLSLLYVGSTPALAGTTYGVMLLSKVFLTVLILFLGALNLRIVRNARAGLNPALLPLRRFAEAELGIGFTILLTTASLTSMPPAIDVRADRVSTAEMVLRMKPKPPRLETPALAELSPATPLNQSESSALPGSFVPGELVHPNNPADIAWSEYNHNWAGIMVTVIGVLAILAHRFGWARAWPLAFLGLAVFLLIRSDSENWPLGPRGFWESFQVAEVAQHRFFVLLIVLFAIFEWAVQTRRLELRRAGLVFPLVCAVGGALLMLHSHSLGNIREEFLIELSHIPLALLAVGAGWCRWLEIRLPLDRTRVVAWIWPVCFVLIGGVLMLYRES